MLFDETMHMHVGYYEMNHDLEGIFLKVLNEDVWCLFYNDEEYEFKIPNKSAYPILEAFGCLVGMYFISDKELTLEKGTSLFYQFLIKIK
ncbi:DUF3986 family protein [Alkalicoccobacillus gibsonii]|uniref:DUF3986 family protein n=1 Tax=Alkalicoccobacillus gibsonii TaxID=79881 RepID=UPI003515B3CC